MPTREQLEERWASEFEFPSTRTTDDPLYQSPEQYIKNMDQNKDQKADIEQWQKGDIVFEEGGHIGVVLDIYILNFMPRLLTACSSNTPYWANASHFKKVKNPEVLTAESLRKKDEEIEILKDSEDALAGKVLEFAETINQLQQEVERLKAQLSQSFTAEKIKEAEIAEIKATLRKIQSGEIVSAYAANEWMEGYNSREDLIKALRAELEQLNKGNDHWFKEGYESGFNDAKQELYSKEDIENAYREFHQFSDVELFINSLTYLKAKKEGKV